MIDLNIQTDRLVLKPMTRNDASALFAYRSRPEVYCYQTWAPEKIEDAEQFIIAYSENKIPKIDEWFQFGIYLEEQLVGDCGFCLREKNKAEIGYTISPDFQTNGYGTEVVQELINFLVLHFDVPQIVASCDPRNAASISLLEKLGFQRDGYYPQSMEIRGELVDDEVYVKRHIKL